MFNILQTNFKINPPYLSYGYFLNLARQKLFTQTATLLDEKVTRRFLYNYIQKGTDTDDTTLIRHRYCSPTNDIVILLSQTSYKNIYYNKLSVILYTRINQTFRNTRKINQQPSSQRN